MPVVCHVVLNLGWVNAVFLHDADKALIDFNWIFANNDAIGNIVFACISIPFSLANAINRVPCFRIDVKNSLKHIFAVWGEHFGSLEVTCHDFFVEFVRVGVFEWQKPT